MQFTYRSIKCNNICSLPLFAYGIHMLMMSLVFFSSCVCACVFVCCLFLSCVFFPLYFLPSSHSLCIAKQKDAENFDSYFLFLRRKKSKYTHAIFTSSCLVIKGEVRRVPQLFQHHAPDFDM